MLDLTASFHGLQRQLFPALAAKLAPLAALDQQFCEVISLTDLGSFTQTNEGCGEGRPPCLRVCMADVFLAKNVYQFPFPRTLIHAQLTRPTLRQLCGWEAAAAVPGEATFSRTFSTFARDQRPQRVHEPMVKRHAGPQQVGHVSRDATTIEDQKRVWGDGGGGFHAFRRARFAWSLSRAASCKKPRL